MIFLEVLYFLNPPTFGDALNTIVLLLFRLMLAADPALIAIPAKISMVSAFDLHKLSVLW